MTSGRHGAIALLMRIERLVTEVSVIMACGLLSAAALAGLYQVLTRFVLQEPATWSETLVRTLLIWMTYLGMAGAIRVGALVSVDVLYRASRGRMRKLLEAFITLATLFLLGLLFWFGWDLAYRVRFQNLAGLEVPMSWAYAAIPVGSALSVLAVLAHYFDPQRDDLHSAV
jgi:TRAP-type C4-dicarboxylate transport system permease small subunit